MRPETSAIKSPKRVGRFTGLIIAVFLAPILTGLLPAPLHAQQFATVSPLFFTKPFGGADPLPQTLTIASAGAAFNFTRTVSTFTGGNWLTVDNVSWNNCVICATPATITAIVTASPALAVGTYTGQIVVTSQTGTVSMTVGVTLTVEPSTGAFFDNVPGQMSFSLKTNGLAPPSQSIQLRNAGAGQLNWTLSRSTADGGNWLSISATSGTAPATVSVTVVKQNIPGGGLTPGTLIGQLLFQTPGGNVTVPVSLAVGDNVFRQVNGISFTKVFGGANPLPQTLTISSTGTSFDFTRTVSTATGGAWLTVDNVSWNNCVLCTMPATMTAVVNANPTLPVGTYTGQIAMTTIATVRICLTMGNASFLYFLCFQISLPSYIDRSSPPVRSLPSCQNIPDTLDP